MKMEVEANSALSKQLAELIKAVNSLAAAIKAK